MHDVCIFVPFYLVDYQASRIDVIAHESTIVVTADLRLQHHHYIGVSEMAPPIAITGEIGMLGSDVRVHLSKHGKISVMLVEYDDIRIPVSAQSDNQVLANQPCAARQYYFSYHHVGCGSYSLRRLKSASGSNRMIAMTNHQKPGV